MNNEYIKSSKSSTPVSPTPVSTNQSISTSNNSNATVETSFSSLSSLSPFASPTSASYLNSIQIDDTVNAIAAVVNAGNSLPVTTHSNAAAVVAVAVSSLAAAIIPDTPIVSIAGSTLSEITTTTTSTKTTPTPVPTNKETSTSNNTPNSSRNLNSKDLQNRTFSSASALQSSPYSLRHTSDKGLNSMSFASSSIASVLASAANPGANTAAEIDNNNTTITNAANKHMKTNLKCTAKDSVSTSCVSTTKEESLSTAIATENMTITTATTSSTLSSTSQPAIAPASKTDDARITTRQNKSKHFLSESWEESRLKDWDDSKLKELLEEAYSYKNPRDKENKSTTFLKLLKKVENEDQSYPFRVTSRGSRNLSNSIASDNYHHQNAHYHSHNHNHNRSHNHKQGGSLQDLFEIGLREYQLDCDQTFGNGIGSNQRTRRQNHNSRQKKYSSSVSSRQREGGSLPSNVNVTHQLSGVGGSVGAGNDIGFMQLESVGGNIGIAGNTAKISKKDQRRNAFKTASIAIASSTETKENISTNSIGESGTICDNTSTLIMKNLSHTPSGDFIIDMGEPMMDIQQQQKILQCKGSDATKQGHSFYERLTSNDKRIPRANIIGSTKGSYFAPTTSHCYVDETVRFNALERNGDTNNGPTISAIDAKFLPLDENYKSCKSVLGSEGDKSPDMHAKTKSNSIYSKISSPGSGSAVLAANSNNIGALTQRELDENDIALNEIITNSTCTSSSSGTTIKINALLNSGGNVSTSSATLTISPHIASTTTVPTSATVTATITSGTSQAKAKIKKKSQQERNTKTVDVESVAGYRGKDPIEELVKYIESSGSKSSEKKKERKKDKEKHQKLKKSNSLEELRSGAKMEVHELKRTAATTESNAVLVRQKSGGGKQTKNNSSSTDINKHFEGKNATQTANSRKSDRRSWGNEELKYHDDQQNINFTTEDKTLLTAAVIANSVRESKCGKGGAGSSGGIGDEGGVEGLVKLKEGLGGDVGVGSGELGVRRYLTPTAKEEKETKEKTNERITMQTERYDKLDKLDKSDKMDHGEINEKFEKHEKLDNKLDKLEKRKKHDIPSNAVTVVDILAVESVLPETAEFHVVTKKKKPKKQKVINNLEETTVTFNRTHNYTMQKTSTFNQQQQQMTVRYKYNHDNPNPNTNVLNTNIISQNQQQQQQHASNFNASVGGINSHQHQHQDQNQQNSNFINTDKSRRKSTSSVPPSEKSDSSDLDSVHSLPIESSKATTATTNTTRGNTQHRCAKNSNIACLGNNTSSFTLNKKQNSPAPISYADITRTSKEIADAVTFASSSDILINNNEISADCGNLETIVNNETVTTDLLNDDKSMAIVNPTATVTGTLPNAATKPHKIKKLQIKQDFPELVSTSVTIDDKFLNVNAIQKTITYSQSLTALTNPVQNSSTTLSHGNDFSSTYSDVNTKASPIEQNRSVIVHQNVNIPQLQHPQQQILQKSRSVENDSITFINSSSSYMASLESNNLDQQYPALEKTVKRHSSANVATITNASHSDGGSTITNQPTFNFAAAAKQQIATNVSEQRNMNLNVNLALTTSNISNTILIDAIGNTNTNNNSISICGNSGSSLTATNINTNANINVNKKSKEKCPALPTTNNLTIIQQITDDINMISSNTNTNTKLNSINVITSTTNQKKSKKERQQFQQQQQQSLLDSFQTKQNNVYNKRLSKMQLKSSNSIPLGASTQSINRPAVIILNDDRNSGSYAAGNQFTFGDFNEEELKLLDDRNSAENIVDDIVENQPMEEKYQKSSDVAMKSPSTTYFNDSGASCSNDIANNSTSDMLLSSSIDASSPNSSFVINNHGNSVMTTSHMTAPGNNQFSDSGIYTDKTKSSNSSCSSNSSGGGSGSSIILKQRQKQQEERQHQKISPKTVEDNKLNTFLSNTRCRSVHTSMDNLDPPPPPPQQLETCNDIETAIIAAARAASKHRSHHHHQQQQQEQQQQHKNFNTSSNSSSFSSSSFSSTSSCHQPHHTNYNNSNKSYQNQHVLCGSSNIMPCHELHQQVYDDDNVSFAKTPRSHSPSRPSRISIAGGTVSKKEFDVHFIPPTTMPTAFSTQQHNDTIIDFIGSAWEEVANSKVTKVYDGQ